MLAVVHRAELRAAACGRGRPRAGLHPCRSGLREDDDDHASGREPGCDRGLSLRRDPRGHVHRQGGRRDARSARGARRAGRALLDLPRGCARPAEVLRGRAAAEDPRVEGAAAPLHREHAATALPLPPGRRPRDRDRVGEEPAHSSVRVPELARRPRAADPEGPHAPRLPRVRAAQGRPGLRRLRGPDRAGDPALRRRRGRARLRFESATRPSRSTSTRTSTCSSRRSSTAGSATGTSCARSATTTSRSTPSRARARSTCSRCLPGFRTRR